MLKAAQLFLGRATHAQASQAKGQSWVGRTFLSGRRPSPWDSQVWEDGTLTQFGAIIKEESEAREQMEHKAMLEYKTRAWLTTLCPSDT